MSRTSHGYLAKFKRSSMIIQKVLWSISHTHNNTGKITKYFKVDWYWETVVPIIIYLNEIEQHRRDIIICKQYHNWLGYHCQSNCFLNFIWLFISWLLVPINCRCHSLKLFINFLCVYWLLFMSCFLSFSNLYTYIHTLYKAHELNQLKKKQHHVISNRKYHKTSTLLINVYVSTLSIKWVRCLFVYLLERKCFNWLRD